MIFIIFRYRYSVLRAVRSQIVFHISNTRNTWEREREREERKREMSRRKWERAEQIYRWSTLSFAISKFFPVFLFRSRGSLKFSTFNMSRSTHESCSSYSIIITSFGSHACVIEEWESRSFLIFLTISIRKNRQLLIAASCALGATQLILNLRLPFKLLPIKHNYCSFIKKKNKEKEDIEFDETKLEIRHFAGDHTSISSIRSRFSSRGSTLPTEKRRTTYIYRHVYICTYVYVCVRLAYRYYFIVLYSGWYRLSFFFLSYAGVRVRTYNRYKYKSQANIS